VSAAILAHVFSGRSAVAAGIAAAEVDAQTVVVTVEEAAAIAAEGATAGAGVLSAGPAGAAEEDGNSIAAAADVLDTAIPAATDIGGHN
jgi:hypothetical protein